MSSPNSTTTAEHLFDALVQADDDEHGQAGVPWRDYFASRGVPFRPRADETVHILLSARVTAELDRLRAEERSPGLDDAIAKALDLLQELPEMGAPVRRRGPSPHRMPLPTAAPIVALAPSCAIDAQGATFCWGTGRRARPSDRAFQ